MSSVETTVNKFNRDHFPKLPELSFKGEKLYEGAADYLNGRVRINVPDEFVHCSDFAVEDLVGPNRKITTESRLANYMAHEGVHHERT